MILRLYEYEKKFLLNFSITKYVPIVNCYFNYVWIQALSFTKTNRKYQPNKTFMNSKLELKLLF